MELELTEEQIEEIKSTYNVSDKLIETFEQAAKFYFSNENFAKFINTYTEVLIEESYFELISDSINEYITQFGEKANVSTNACLLILHYRFSYLLQIYNLNVMKSIYKDIADKHNINLNDIPTEITDTEVLSKTLS